MQASTITAAVLAALSATGVQALSAEASTAAAKNTQEGINGACWAFAQQAASEHAKPASLDAYLFMVRATCDSARKAANADAKRWTALASACSTVVSAAHLGVPVSGATKATVSKGIKAARELIMTNARKAFFEANPTAKAALSPDALIAQQAAEIAQQAAEIKAFKAALASGQLVASGEVAA